MLELKQAGYSVGKIIILKNINAQFVDGAFNVILGPNGAGKSTLLKLATGILTPSVGEVFLDEKNMSTFSAKNLSLKRAVLSQHVDMIFPLTVKEVVTMGRYPHFDNTPSVFDRQIIEYALEKVGMIDKATQNYPTLSGGEKQKVQMARVLAQIGHQNPEDKTPKYLFLDEPTTSLDIRFQLQILDLTKELLNQNVTVIAILHDLNLSFQYGNNFFFLQHGQLIHQTADKQTISESLIESIYEVKARKQTDIESKEETWRFRLS